MAPPDGPVPDPMIVRMQAAIARNKELIEQTRELLRQSRKILADFRLDHPVDRSTL